MAPFLRAAIVALLLPAAGACSVAIDDESEWIDRPRAVSVRVYYGDSATPNVLVKVPLRAVTGAIRLASVARALGASIEIDTDALHNVRLDEVDLAAAREALEEMKPGPVLQVEDCGERVEIWID